MANEELVAGLREKARRARAIISTPDEIVFDQAADALESADKRIGELATMMLINAMYMHHVAKNHTGDFELCDVPMCKTARELRDGADLDMAKAWCEKEKAWLRRIVELEEKVGTLERTIDALNTKSDGLIDLNKRLSQDNHRLALQATKLRRELEQASLARKEKCCDQD